MIFNNSVFVQYKNIFIIIHIRMFVFILVYLKYLYKYTSIFTEAYLQLYE